MKGSARTGVLAALALLALLGSTARAAGTTIVPDRFLRRWDPLTVFFDRDAGPAAGGPEDRPDAFARLEPAHPGAWTWLDGRTLQFRPADPWPPLARFSVAAGGAAATVDTLMSPPVETIPEEGAAGLDPLREVTIVFPEPLEAAALERMLAVELRPLPGVGASGGRMLGRGDFAVRALERAALADPARYAVAFREPVPWGTRLLLRFRLSLGDAAGAFAEVSLSTAEPFRPVAAGLAGGRLLPLAAGGSRYPREQALAGGAGQEAVVVDFSAPPAAIDAVAARSLVRFTPPVNGLAVAVEGARLRVRGAFDHETLYRVDLEPADLADERGRRLAMPGGSSFWFHLRRPSPYVRWGAAQGIVERFGPQMAPLEGRGEERVDLRIHRVDPLDRSFWPFPDRPVLVDESQRPPGPGEEPAAAGDRAATPGEIARLIAALGSPAVSTLADLPLRRASGSATFGLDLAPHFARAAGPGAPGHWLVGIRHLDRSATRAWMRVQVTDLALATVEEPAAVRFSVTSLATGAPVAGARVRVEGWRRVEGGGPSWSVLAEGSTDAEGAFRWPAPGPKARERRTVARIVVEQGGDVLALDASRPPDRYGDNLWQPARESWLQWAFETAARDAPQPELLCHVYTERPLYRPEEEVFIAGWVRRRAAGRLAIPSLKGAVVVRGPGDLEWRHPAALSATGAFFLRFARERLPAGEYAARFEGPDGAVLGETAFRVEAYRLPLFEVRLHAPDATPLDRDFTVGLAASYYAGGPVAGRPVQWRVTQFPHAWTPEKRPGFLYSSDGRWSKAGRFESTPALSRQDATDASGAASIAVNPAAEPTAHPREYVIEATVTGADDQTVTATRRVLALPPFVLGVKVARFLERAERVAPEVIAIGPGGEPVAGLPVTVRLLRRQWHSVLVAGDFSAGAAKYRTDVVDERIAEATVRSGPAPVAVPFALPGAGVYVVEVEARDRLERAQTLAVDLYAGGAGPLAWPKPAAGVFTAAPDRKEYAPGETAAIVLASPFQSGRVLAVVEAPEGNEYRWLEVAGGAATFRLPILPTYAPRVPVHFVLSRGRIAGTAPLPATGTDLGRPATLAATAWLAVAPVGNRVEVRLEHPAKARPGERLPVTIRLADPRGMPLAGEVALWLVDQAVLSLGRERRLDPLPDFISPVRSRLGVRDTRNLALGFLPFAEVPGGDAAAQEAPDLLDRTTVRRDFRSVPYFNPAIAVGPDGTATVEVALPDNLTLFKVRAKAASGAERFGFAAGEVAVRLPVIVQPALPRFVRPGDAFEAAAVGRVVEGAGGAGSGQMRVAGASLAGSGRVELALAPNRPERFAFPVTVPTPAFSPAGKGGAGEVVVQGAFERAADGARDAFEARLPIRDDRERVRLRALLDLAPGGTAAIPALPGEARPGTVRRRILLSGDPALVKMAAGLDFLARYPYGCTEQRVSEARAHVALARFRESLGIGEGDAPGADAVRQALEWLPGVVDEGGLAAYWPGGRGYVSLTAWTVRFLAEARAAGFPVDGKLFERMTAALGQALRSDYGRFVDGEAFTERCLALGALAAAGKLDAAYAADLARQARFLNLEGSAEVLLALAQPGARAGAEAIGELARKLVDGVATRLREGREVYAGLREDWSGRNPLVLPDETATVAVMAEALARAGAGGERRRILAEALVALGDGDGWGSTRANAAALLALARLAQQPAGEGRALAATVRVGSDRGSLATGRQRPAATFASADPGAGEVRLDGREGAPALARVDSEYVPLADGGRVAPAAAGFVVTRELLLVRPGGTAPERFPLEAGGETLRFAVGDVIEERVRVVNPQERHFVAVVVPLAAGFEPLNPALATAPPEARPAGATTLAPTWASYLDDQAAFYYDTLPKGTFDFAFRTRATVAGSFVQPPAKAELMYDGAVRGNGAGARVEIARP